MSSVRNTFLRECTASLKSASHRCSFSNGLKHVVLYRHGRKRPGHDILKEHPMVQSLISILRRMHLHKGLSSIEHVNTCKLMVNSSVKHNNTTFVLTVTSTVSSHSPTGVQEDGPT